jgi:hypothetical protein
MKMKTIKVEVTVKASKHAEGIKNMIARVLLFNGATVSGGLEKMIIAPPELRHLEGLEIVFKPSKKLKK